MNTLKAIADRMAADQVRLICASCKQERLISRLDAFNGRSVCYHCETPQPFEVGSSRCAKVTR